MTPFPLKKIYLQLFSIMSSEIETLEDELPQLQKRLRQAEADLVKASEGENKATTEVRHYCCKNGDFKAEFG